MNSTDFSINTSSFSNNNSIISPEIGEGVNILQLNIEGISADKCEILAKLNSEECIDIAVIQETHITEEGNRSYVRGYTMVASLHHDKFGIATYVKNDLLPSVQPLPPINQFCSGIKINDLKS